MQHFCHFNKHVLNPIKRSGYVGEGRKAMLKLKNEVPSCRLPLSLSPSRQVLDKILLRRTKTTRSEDIQLPPRSVSLSLSRGDSRAGSHRIVNIRKEPLDEQEDDFYQALYTQVPPFPRLWLMVATVTGSVQHLCERRHRPE
jgi:DNA repair protein RAD16